jgi:hypothetical protein
MFYDVCGSIPDMGERFLYSTKRPFVFWVDSASSLTVCRDCHFRAKAAGG